MSWFDFFKKKEIAEIDSLKSCCQDFKNKYNDLFNKYQQVSSDLNYERIKREEISDKYSCIIDIEEHIKEIKDKSKFEIDSLFIEKNELIHDIENKKKELSEIKKQIENKL